MEEPKQFRPISLTSVYKTISKVLAKRIIEVVGKVVGDYLSALVKGKHIHDGVLIANDCVEAYRADTKKGLVVKLDFEKL